MIYQTRPKHTNSDPPMDLEAQKPMRVATHSWKERLTGLFKRHKCSSIALLALITLSIVTLSQPTFSRRRLVAFQCEYCYPKFEGTSDEVAEHEKTCAVPQNVKFIDHSKFAWGFTYTFSDDMDWRISEVTRYMQAQGLGIRVGDKLIAVTPDDDGDSKKYKGKRLEVIEENKVILEKLLKEGVACTITLLRPLKMTVDMLGKTQEFEESNKQPKGSIKISGAGVEQANGWYHLVKLPKTFPKDETQRLVFRQRMQVKTKEIEYTRNKFQYTLECWREGFGGRPCYEGPFNANGELTSNNFGITYNGLKGKGRWSLSSWTEIKPKETRQKAHAQLCEAHGRSLYRIKSTDQVPPTGVWELHSSNGGVKPPTLKNQIPPISQQQLRSMMEEKTEDGDVTMHWNCHSHLHSIRISGISGTKELELANGLYKAQDEMCPKDFPEEMTDLEKRTRLLMGPSDNLEKWMANFKGRRWYKSEKGCIISYNGAKETWSILSSLKTAGTGRGGKDKKCERYGRAIFKVKSNAKWVINSAKDGWYNKETDEAWKGTFPLEYVFES